MASRQPLSRKGPHHALRLLLAQSLHPREKRHRLLGAEIAGLGLSGPALIVASRSPIRLLSGTWKRTFAEAGIAYAVHEFGGECSLAEIERIKQVAKQHKSQVVVGAGGGKVLDAARAAAADLKLPVVTCPTVASSDAPCSALSVIYSDEGVVECSRIYRKNPDLVLVDTQVIALSPPRLLVAGMGDALATWFEAKTCVRWACQKHARRLIDAECLGIGETLLPNSAG